MKYSAAFFDLDGVITDSEPLHEAAFRQMLQTHGFELSAQAYADYFLGKSDRDGLEGFFNAINDHVDITALANEKAELYPHIANEHLRPYPGIVGLLEELSNRIPLVLVTGSLRDEADAAMKTIGIRDYFKAVIAAEDVNEGKPSPEGYLKAARIIGVPMSECVVVEDSVSGVEAAKASGAQCIAVTTTRPDGALALADRIVDKLSLDLFQIH